MANEKPFIGQMDKVIEVYKTTSIANETGERKETEVLVAKPWAMLEELPGSQEVDGKITSVINRSFTIRRNPAILDGGLKMFVKYRDVKYEVYAIREIQRSHLKLIVRGYE